MTARPKIIGRKSPLAAIFVQAIIPRVDDADTLAEALERFGIPQDKCAYCGGRRSDLDHFFAIVKNKRPSGYFHCARNLVPSCGKCNQSKGGLHWEEWMLGNAKHSPRTRRIRDLDERVKKLRRFEKWGKLKPVSENILRDAVGDQRWEAYWQRIDKIGKIMLTAQREADCIRTILEEKFGEAKATAPADRAGKTQSAPSNTDRQRIRLR